MKEKQSANDLNGLRDQIGNGALHA